MSKKRKNGRSVRSRNWILPLGLFLSLLLIMLFIDGSPWTLNFRYATFIERLLNSKFFTEWFTPYSKPELNILTVLFAIILLPETAINAILGIKSRREKLN